MNRYGAQAMRHWRQIDPERYNAIPDPEAFFTQLGAQVESEIQALADAIAGPDRPGESYLQKVGRLNMARFNAESDILREMVLIPDPDDPEIDERPATDPLTESDRAIQRLMDEENFRQDDEQEIPEVPPAG
ncbi:MAG: TnpV protein [Solirubrobacteraceae bacterium]